MNLKIYTSYILRFWHKGSKTKPFSDISIQTMTVSVDLKCRPFFHSARFIGKFGMKNGCDELKLLVLV